MIAVSAQPASLLRRLPYVLAVACLLSASTAQAEGEGAIYKGAILPIPDQDQVRVHLDNRGQTDLNCKIEIAGTAVNSNGDEGSVYADPIERLLRGQRTATYTVELARNLNWMRQNSGDWSWRLKSVSPQQVSFSCKVASGAGGQGQRVDIPSASYMFTTTRSGKCLNVEMPSLGHPSAYENYARVLQWDCPPPNNEWNNNYWRVEPIGNGRARLRSERSNKCLAANRAAGSSVFQYECNSALALQLMFESYPGSFGISLRDGDSNLCVSLNPGSSGLNNADYFVLASCAAEGQDTAGMQSWTYRNAH